MTDALTQRVRELTELVEPFGFDVKIDLGRDGVIHIASTEAPVEVSNEDKPASTTLQVSPATLEAILAGRQNVMSAYMFGKVRVKGDLDKVMALAKALTA
ncbi:MAG: SCP2 sterol-binding domain-containing protein [Woeseiaceae bacterium]|jgi:putative sterol carrier protein|nr:SCP2 sterol-binding domain-containing protein [Woeseiaceae bacterium]